MATRSIIRLYRNFEALAFFNRVMDLFFKLLIFFVVLVLAIGLFRIFLEIWKVMGRSDLKEAFGLTVTNLLTFFIILELFKSLVEYFREHTGKPVTKPSTSLHCRFTSPIYFRLNLFSKGVEDGCGETVSGSREMPDISALGEVLSSGDSFGIDAGRYPAGSCQGCSEDSQG